MSAEGRRLTELAVEILDYARDHGRVLPATLSREFGANANTLKVTFTSLVEKGLLMRHGGGRSTWYALPGHIIKETGLVR